MNELFSARDDAHFLRAADSRALQHGEDGGSGVTERAPRVRTPNARGSEQRGKQVAGPGRADRQPRGAHAPALRPLDGKGLDLAVRRVR
jgi:hypothetical protein